MTATVTRPSRPSRQHTPAHVAYADPIDRARARLLVLAAAAIVALFAIGCLVGGLQLLLNTTVTG